MPSQFGSQPIELFTDVRTMNVTDHSTSLKEGEAQLIQNLLRDKGAWRVREGMTNINSGGALYARPYGLATFDPLDSDTPQYVAIANGALYAGATFALTLKMSGFSTSTFMRLQPYKGVMLINDPSQGLAFYDGIVGGWAGCPSPRVSRLIYGFEDLTNVWTTLIGGTGAVTPSSLGITQGRRATKFKATAGSNWSFYLMITSLDATTFPAAPMGDGTASTVLDYIHIRLTRSYKSDFDSCTLYLYTTADRLTYYSIVLSDLSEWINEPSAGVTFDLLIRKSAFTSTSGNWATLQGIGFNIDAATGMAPFITVDYIQLEKGGPLARDLGKKIADMEASDTWAWVAGAGSFSYDSFYKKNFSRSLVATGAVTVSETVALDLTSFDNGIPAATLDSIQFAVAKSSTKENAATLTLNFYYDAINFYSIAITGGDVKGTPITPNLYKKLSDTSVCFTTFEKREAVFTPGAGTPTWATITKVALVATGAGDFYIDSIRLVKTRDKRSVVLFESTVLSPTETYTVTNATEGWATQENDINKIRTEEGSSTSKRLTIKKDTVCTIDIALGSDVDCSTFIGGGTVQDQDLIGPYIWFEDASKVIQLDFLYDTNDGTFSSYYQKSIPQAAIPQIKKGWMKARFQVNEHLKVGATGAWANIDKVRIQITTGPTGSGTDVYLDQLIIERSDKLNGTFWYRVKYENARGAQSEYSNISNSVEMKGGATLLTNLPTSTGMVRHIERLGGNFTDWREVGLLADDETTFFLDNFSDSEVGSVAQEKVYSKPWVAKTFCIFKDLVVQGNLTSPDGNRYKSGIRVGREYSFEEFDQDSFFELGKDDGYELLALIPGMDRVYAIKERGMYAFDPYRPDQVPVVINPDLGCVGLWAWASSSDGLAFLTPDRELYWFNGGGFENMGKMELGNVQRYLDEIPDDYVGIVTMTIYKRYLLISLTSSSGLYNDTVLCYYIPEKSWSVIIGWPVALWWNQTFSGKAKLLFGTTGTYLYQGFLGDTDDGAAIVGILWTKDVGRNFLQMKQPATLTLITKLLAGTPTVVISYYYSMTNDAGNNVSITISSSTYQRDQKGVPPFPAFTTYVGVKVTITGRITLLGGALTLREESVK